jgi:hypothetical protein
MRISGTRLGHFGTCICFRRIIFGSQQHSLRLTRERSQVHLYHIKDSKFRNESSDDAIAPSSVLTVGEKSLHADLNLIFCKKQSAPPLNALY